MTREKTPRVSMVQSQKWWLMKRAGEVVQHIYLSQKSDFLSFYYPCTFHRFWPYEKTTMKYCYEIKINFIMKYCYVNHDLSGSSTVSHTNCR